MATTLEQRIRDEIKTVRKQVEYILKTYPQTRNSDTMLEWIWMKRFAEVKNLPTWTEFSAQRFSLETVRRNRQTLQNTKGLYLPTDPIVRKKRKIKEAIYHQEFSPPPPEDYGDSV